jgi:septal ring factor EnvC (AmiA/AmiB activator)
MSVSGARDTTKWRYSPMFGHFQYDQDADIIIKFDGSRYNRPRHVSAPSILSLPSTDQPPSSQSGNRPLHDRTARPSIPPLASDTWRVSTTDRLGTGRKSKTLAKTDADGDEDDDDTDEDETVEGAALVEDMDASSEEDASEEDARSEEDLDEDETGNETDDGHNNRNPVPLTQGALRGRFADPPTRINKERSRPESGDDVVAAFKRYSAGQKVEANTTMPRIVELNERSYVPTSPLQAIPQPAVPAAPVSQQRLNHDPRPPTRKSGYATSSALNPPTNSSNLQRPIGHAISGQTLATTVLSLPQNRITTSTKPMEVPPKTPSSPALAGPSAHRDAEGLPRPHNVINQTVQNFFGPTMVQNCTGADRQSSRPDMAKGLTAVRDERVRSNANAAQREKQLIEDRVRLEHQVDELRKQGDAKDKDREAECRRVSQQSKQAADLQSENTEKIKRLDEQLHRSQRTADLQPQNLEKIKRLEEQLQRSQRTAELQSQNTEKIKRLEDQVRRYRHSEALQARQAAKSESPEQELHACRAKLSKAEEACKRNEAERRANEPQNRDSGEESEDYSDSEESGDEQDSPGVCLSCAESHSAICALREQLGSKGLGGSKMPFLARLNPGRSVDELVAILCESLRDFLPLHEKHARNIEAKLRDADTSLADYKDKLAESECKVSELEKQLDKARMELKEARAKNVTGHASPPAPQEQPVLQATTSWVDIRWPLNRETQKRENAFDCSI